MPRRMQTFQARRRPHKALKAAVKAALKVRRAGYRKPNGFDRLDFTGRLLPCVGDSFDDLDPRTWLL